MIWAISGTHLWITLSLMTSVLVSVWIFLLQASNSDWFTNRGRWVLVRCSMFCESLQVTLWLLVEMNWLCDSLISHTLSPSDLTIDKSSRVCWVETEISISQSRCFCTDLLQGCWAIRATVESVSLSSLGLLIKVTWWTYSSCAVVFFSPQSWVVTVLPCIYSSAIVIPLWTYRYLLHLCVPISHLLVLRYLCWAESLPLTDILIVSSNVSVKTGSLWILLLRNACTREIGVAACLASAMVVLHVGGSHTMVELTLGGVCVVFHYMTHLTRQSLWKGLDFCWLRLKKGNLFAR